MGSLNAVRVIDDSVEIEKQRDLERQCRNMEASETDKIVCPWCFAINKKDVPPCCDKFTEGLNRRGQRQLQSVIDQQRDILSGRRVNLNCPYCHSLVKKKNLGDPVDWIRPNHSPFCCDNLSDAITAIVERGLLNRLTEDKKRIEDNQARISAKSDPKSRVN